MKPNIYRRHVPTARQAFTLIEILVTITIIVLIAALAIAGTSRIRTHAARSISMGNLKQLQIANASYAVDQNGRYVSVAKRNGDNKIGDMWLLNTSFLESFRGDLGVTATGKVNTSVPISMLDPVAVRAKASMYNDIRASYAGVLRPGSTVASSDSSYLASELVSPERTAAFTTATDWQVIYGSRFSWKGVEGKTQNAAIAYRHDDHALVAYYDGHVGMVSMNDIREIDSQGGQKNLFWSGTGK